MQRRIVIAGASGFIGHYLSERYRARGDNVSTIGRSSADVAWGDPAGIAAILNGADLLINLAGKSVNCRYTSAHRAEILRSRVETTRQLAHAILACTAPPALWLNSSTATIYRHADDRPMTEAGGELGTGFSVEIAKSWENEFFAPALPETRRVALRMAIVLGDGSALIPLFNLARFGLGGAQRDGRWFSTRKRREAGTFHEYRPTAGKQKFSWVHIEDVAAVIDFIERESAIDGVLNVSAPAPSDNATVMGTVRNVIGVPWGLPSFRWMLEIGSAAIRTETELVLKSRWVIPERLQQLGYQFIHPDLEPALRAIVSEKSGH